MEKENPWASLSRSIAQSWQEQLKACLDFQEQYVRRQTEAYIQLMTPKTSDD